MERNAFSGVRTLYSENYLGIDRYADQRSNLSRQMGNMREKFIARMKQQLSIPASMIFTEDLKTMIHLCDDKEEDLEVVLQMLKRFHKQNKELRFGTFVFGPVALRLFYFLKKPKLVLELFNDEELDGFFDQLKSYTLSMDLLFKSEMYQEVLELDKQAQAKQLVETRFPRDIVSLSTAACYKLNTPETFMYATEMVTKAREAKANILRKALTFVVGLALNQGKPDVAMEILSSIDRNNNITCNNLKLITFAELDRLQDAFGILRRVTDQDNPTQSRIYGEICQCTIDALQKAVDKEKDTEMNHIFEQLCRSLKDSDSITSQTIDELLCLPIDVKPIPREGRALGRQRNPLPSERTFMNREMGSRSSNFDYTQRRRTLGSYDDD